MTTASRTTHFDRWPVGRRVGNSRRGERGTADWDRDTERHHTQDTSKDNGKTGTGTAVMAVQGQKESTCRLFSFFSLVSGGLKKKEPRRPNRYKSSVRIPSLFLFLFLCPLPLVSFYSSLFLIRIASKRVLIQPRDRAHPDSEFRLGFTLTPKLLCLCTFLYSPTFERILNYWGRSIATA